jgi:hypothetical protein
MQFRSLSCTPSSHAICSLSKNLTAGGSGEAVLEQLLGLVGPFAESFCDEILLGVAHHIGWMDGGKLGLGLTFGLEDLLVAVVRGHVPGVLGLAVLFFFVELVADGFDELLAGLLQAGLWSVLWSFFDRKLQGHSLRKR